MTHKYKNQKKSEISDLGGEGGGEGVRRAENFWLFSWEPALWTLMSGGGEDVKKNVWKSDRRWEPEKFKIFKKI